mgnify:FL=1
MMPLANDADLLFSSSSFLLPLLLTVVQRRLHERAAHTQSDRVTPKLGQGRGERRGLRVGGGRHFFSFFREKEFLRRKKEKCGRES